MAIRKLDKPEWQPYFNFVSKALTQRRVEIEIEIEVASLAVGDQIAAEWIKLHGLVYDPREDILEVATEGVDHLINHPQDIFVDEAEDGLTVIEIIAPDDVRLIIKLKAPLQLPPPAAAGS